MAGVRYDALDHTLRIKLQIGSNFRSFLAWDGGFGTVGSRNGRPFVEVKSGTIDIKRVIVSGEERSL
jgi:hypothetical protein